MCSEDSRIELCDGVTKIIINSKAAEHEKNEKLKVFLEYMNGKVSDDELNAPAYGVFLTLHFFISLGYIPLYFLKQVLNLL